MKSENKESLKSIDDKTSVVVDDKFFENVAGIIEQARKHVGRTADLTMCVTYFEIGRMIVEREQHGKERAEYGQGLMKGLSKFLTAKFKRGFSLPNLKNAKQFYLTYKSRADPKSAGFDGSYSFVKGQSLVSLFNLSWTHYLVLIRIKNEDERHFYEIETANNQWSVRELKRQYYSSLYQRLALSRDKDEVMRLAREGQIVEEPRDLLKGPIVLEFLGMAEDPSYSESDLESAIISKLQSFLLELGKGFLFEARQKRFTFNERSFFVDLVLYNRLLQCYVLIDLKSDELKHQDLGQMQMYVHFFDRFVKKNFEKPTVGILLCREKDNSIVELTLSEDPNIYAYEYSLYLPDKNLLQQKLEEWTREFEDAKATSEITKKRSRR